MFLIRVSISGRIQPKIFHIFRLMTVAGTFTRKISPAPLLQRGVIDCEAATKGDGLSCYPTQSKIQNLK
jgi:hypothetical protein